MLDRDLEFLRHHHAGDVGHTGRSLLDHLCGTAALLRAWDLPDHVVRAGLFHSVYGTAAFDHAAVPATRRAELAARIGARAEELVHLFCTLDRGSLYDHAGRDPGFAGFAARDRHTGATITLDPSELRHLFHLACANWLEQRAHLEPERRGARCDDYRRMLGHLVPAARAAVEAAIEQTVAELTPPSLIELFAFTDPAVVDRQCGALDVKYLGAVSRRLLDTAAPELIERLHALGDDAYLAILRAPETCYRVFAAGAAGDDLATYLDDALRVEEWRAGVRVTLDRPAWSAIGDVCVPAGVPHEPVPGGVLRAPVIGGIVVDLGSPAVRRPLGQLAYKQVPFGPSEPFTDTERALVLDRIAGALGGIARTNPIVTQFLRYTLHTIIPRKQTQPHLYPQSFKGSSTAATLHRANIYNIQQANVDVARLAQSILHEAVHNHLYKRELFQPTLVDTAAGEALRVTSPWSGNTLDLYVFVHSSTVYYALHQFFSHPAAATHLPPATVAWFKNRAVHGFGSPAWAEIVDAHGALIAPAVRRDLWAMREIVAGAGAAAAQGVAA